MSGRDDATLCRRRAHQQCRHGKSHEGAFARRTGGDGALHIRPLNTSGPGSSAIAPICQRRSREMAAISLAGPAIDGMTAEELQQTLADVRAYRQAAAALPFDVLKVF